MVLFMPNNKGRTLTIDLNDYMRQQVKETALKYDYKININIMLGTLRERFM